MKLALGSVLLLASHAAISACATGQLAIDDESRPSKNESGTLPGSSGEPSKGSTDRDGKRDRDGAPSSADPDGASTQDGAADGSGMTDASDGGSFTMATQTIHDSASSGTPDSYVYDVLPGDPISASVTGGGGGTWGINASNGTSSGQYCFGAPTCSFTVPAGVTAIMITVITTDIGYYELTVTRPVH